jgi:hypothetical protein
MKISVSSRDGRIGAEPGRLRLGQCSLPVSAVLSRRDDGYSCAFEVRVMDGRRFVVRYQAAQGSWELVAVQGRLAPLVAGPALMPLLVALYRRGLHAARSAIVRPGHHNPTLSPRQRATATLPR